MAITFTKLIYHIIFSTKRREPLISAGLRNDLYAYIGGIARREECVLMAANGTANHMHLLLSLSKNIAASRLVMHVKKDSSRWLNDRPSQKHNFEWQDGYAAFSIGSSQIAAVQGYIARQKKHHQRVSFQDELRAFLAKYGVAYDEKHLWS